MTMRFLFLPLFTTLSLLLASCTVDEPASLLKGAAKTGGSKSEEKSKTAVKGKKEETNLSRAETAKLKADEARELAEAKALAKAEAKEKAEKAALIRKEEAAAAAEAAAKAKAREDALAAKTEAREAAKQAKLAAKQQEELKEATEKAAEEAAEKAAEEIELASTPRRSEGFFSFLSLGANSKLYQSEGHEIFVDHDLLPSLDASNAKIEIDLGDQRARIYRKEGPAKILVIETQISSGKSGHGTPTGTWTIGEKLEQKQSSLYGTWINHSGAPVGSSGESTRRPSGASRFVGADMPYWMRITGGIGMHIGIVPGHPASHGCIRVPASVQPLIFSKVGVGTPVTITL